MKINWMVYLIGIGLLLNIAGLSITTHEINKLKRDMKAATRILYDLQSKVDHEAR